MSESVKRWFGQWMKPAGPPDPRPAPPIPTDVGKIRVMSKVYVGNKDTGVWHPAWFDHQTEKVDYTHMDRPFLFTHVVWAVLGQVLCTPNSG